MASLPRQHIAAGLAYVDVSRQLEWRVGRLIIATSSYSANRELFRGLIILLGIYRLARAEHAGTASSPSLVSRYRQPPRFTRAVFHRRRPVYFKPRTMLILHIACCHAWTYWLLQ